MIPGGGLSPSDLDDEVETKTADLANLGLVQNIHLAELWRAGSGDSQLGLEQR